MNDDFANLYIERLLSEITELNKNRFILETQLKCQESSRMLLEEQLKNNIEEINKLQHDVNVRQLNCDELSKQLASLQYDNIMKNEEIQTLKEEINSLKKKKK